MMKRWIAGYAALMATTLALGAGCGCTEELRWSVVVQLTDDRQAPISDATVTFEADGVVQPCESLLDGAYGCGGEVEGTLVIRVEHAGFHSQEESVSVDADTCHVETEELDLALMPV